MPELPEVETVRRGLVPAFEGAVIAGVVLRREGLRYPFPDRFCDRTIGQQVLSFTRRGKYLVAELGSGEALIMHLGMSGRFTVYGEGGQTKQALGAFHYNPNQPEKHDHVLISLEGGSIDGLAVYNDPRRFGFMDLVDAATIDDCRHFKQMGPEPLSDAFTLDGLEAALRGRRGPIKAALLDQRVVAGLGNIYVCEALFRAGISPKRQAANVVGRRAARLFPAIRTVLEEAIAAGGSSLRDFAAADGVLGYFQHGFDVYDRAGEPCPKCQHEIKRVVQSGRSSFFCVTCQR